RARAGCPCLAVVGGVTGRGIVGGATGLAGCARSRRRCETWEVVWEVTMFRTGGPSLLFHTNWMHGLRAAFRKQSFTPPPPTLPLHLLFSFSTGKVWFRRFPLVAALFALPLRSFRCAPPSQLKMKTDLRSNSRPALSLSVLLP